MKINHTPFGVLSSNKKLVAALALVGGITPTLINNTHAAEGDPYYDPDETIFTTIGPNYFTEANEVRNYYEDGYSVRVADTTVADFYLHSGIRFHHEIDSSEGRANVPEYICQTEYACLQGKKIGETEIILEKSGEETIHIPLVSVELAPEAKSIHELGDSITVTGDLNGADDSLLHLVGTASGYGVNISWTGERNANIITTTTTTGYAPEGILAWQIGNQYVGGGTFYRFMKAEGIDNIYHLPENEEILKHMVMDAMQGVEDYETSIMSSENFSPYMLGNVDITTPDGNILHLNDIKEAAFIGRPIDVLYQGILDFDNTNPAESAKAKLTAGLPEKAKEIDFKDINVSMVIAYLVSSANGRDNPIASANTFDSMAVADSAYSGDGYGGSDSYI